uniref:RING-type domain-containing protein n=1 Tax=Davidia involucrata TaxID=16924 RepID=A0A5B7BIH6_DAVIN
MPTDDYKDDHRHANLRLNPNPNPSTSTSTPNPTRAQYPPPPPKPNPRFLSLLLQAIIMALIISLFLLFLGVAALAFFIAGGVLHRHRIRRRTSQFSDSATPSHSAEDLQKFLPRLKYAAGLLERAKDCAVCLESFKEGEWCRSLPVCNHMFHENCVDNWLTKVPNCPICRSRVQFNSEASASGISDDDCKLLWAVGV